jgi:hypothetical protein
MSLIDSAIARQRQNDVSMDIFKLFFEHDLRLDALRERQLDRSTQEVSGSLEDFLKPDPTYSKFYLTGTVLPDERFGINQLDKFDELLQLFSSVFSGYRCFVDESEISFEQAVRDTAIGKAVILTKEESSRWANSELDLDDDSNVGHRKEALAEVLESGDLVLYKENAHQGFDLHLFSEKNIYRSFFDPLKKLLDDQFRFFSINGKRIRSERKFYFETWTLSRPPHGAEEVFPETVL